MGSPVPLRTDFDATRLRCLACKCGDNRQIRRLLALTSVYNGMNCSEAAKVGGMDRQTVRDWVHRFNEQGPDGLTNKEGAGRPRLITDEQMQELARIVEAGPDPQIDGVVRWRQIEIDFVEQVVMSIIETDVSEAKGLVGLFGQLGDLVTGLARGETH